MKLLQRAGVAFAHLPAIRAAGLHESPELVESDEALGAGCAEQYGRAVARVALVDVEGRGARRGLQQVEAFLGSEGSSDETGRHVRRPHVARAVVAAAVEPRVRVGALDENALQRRHVIQLRCYVSERLRAAPTNRAPRHVNAVRSQQQHLVQHELAHARVGSILEHEIECVAGWVERVEFMDPGLAPGHITAALRLSQRIIVAGTLIVGALAGVTCDNLHRKPLRGGSCGRGGSGGGRSGLLGGQIGLERGRCLDCGLGGLRHRLVVALVAVVNHGRSGLLRGGRLGSGRRRRLGGGLGSSRGGGGDSGFGGRGDRRKGSLHCNCELAGCWSLGRGHLRRLCGRVRTAAGAAGGGLRHLSSLCAAHPLVVVRVQLQRRRRGHAVLVI